MSSSFESYAAIDLGSNSFHMVVANCLDDRIQTVDKLKEMVRLAGGLDEDGHLDSRVAENALECLERFSQRLKNIPLRNIRAVGTNTLREAKNSKDFLKKANKALGVPIEIISGREEARLIFTGVAYSNYSEQGQRMVVDIGGGSTEFAIGVGYEAYLTESLDMGCVTMSQRYFKNGEITAKRMKKAIMAARQELGLIESGFKKAGWEQCLGSSGTINSISDVIAARDNSDRTIRVEALFQLKDAVIQAGFIDKLKFEGLSDNRKPVFAGGVAILCAIFESFDIKSMQPAEGALREGILLDLFGRLHARDIRNKTVTELMQRYGIDEQHAENVRATATACFKQLKDAWKLRPETDLNLIEWAASLHEIGLAISHSQYHKHGEYLLSQSDLAGFSREEQSLLAFLVRSHRRKLNADVIAGLPEESQKRMTRLAIILRLAVLLNRHRLNDKLTELRITHKDNCITLHLPSGWLERHPLTGVDLESEAEYLKAVKIKLKFD